MPREIHLERIVGRKVLSPDGRSVGRLEEVRVERRGDVFVVTEYLIGTTALLERLSLGTVQRHEERVTGGYRASWRQVDFSDPEHPRLTCPVERLRTFPQAGEGQLATDEPGDVD